MIIEAENNLPILIKDNLACWDIPDSARIDLLTISENATFRVTFGNETRIIRIYRPSYHQNDEILSELLWLQAIEQSGIVTVPHLFISRFGKLFVEAGIFRLACFSFIQGQEPQADKALVRRFFELGKISAKLHRQSMNWVRPESFIRKHWSYETMIGRNAIWGNWREAENLSSQDREILENCDRTLEYFSSTFPKDKAHYGLIHGDLRLANLLIDGEKLAVIDFDDCGFSWFGLDLANALSFIEDSPFVPSYINAWLQGYGEVMPVNREMADMIVHLIMMRRLQLTAWLETHNQTPTAKKLRKTFLKGTVELARIYLERVTPLAGRSGQRL